MQQYCFSEDHQGLFDDCNIKFLLKLTPEIPLGGRFSRRTKLKPSPNWNRTFLTLFYYIMKWT